MPPAPARSEPAAHTILVIEDDLLTAKILLDALAAYGFETIHAVTLAEVRAAIRDAVSGERPFCAVILDMQFPLDEGADPNVGCGETALKELRAFDHRQIGEPPDVRYTLPIIIATAFSKELDFTWKLQKKGASEFIPKPFGDRIDKVLDVVRSTLEEAGRKDHGSCGRAASSDAPADVPLAAPAVALSGTPRPAPRVKLVFDGSRESKVSFVRVNGTVCALQNQRFATMFAFATAQLRDWKRYWERKDLGFEGNWEHPSRIVTVFKSSMPEGFELFKRAESTFQLNPEVEVEIAWGSYEDHPVEAVRDLVAKRLGTKKTTPTLD